MWQLYAYVANESTQGLVEDGLSSGLTNTHMALGLSVLYHVFTGKQWILCSALCHKSYFILTYVTSLRDSLCLGTFAHSLIRLLPCNLASLWGCSLAISNQKLVPPLSLCSLVKFYSLIFLFNYGTLKGLTDQSIIIIIFIILVISVPKDAFKCLVKKIVYWSLIDCAFGGRMSSVRRALDCGVGGCGYILGPDQYSGS